jgi:hypothetical protein
MFIKENIKLLGNKDSIFLCILLISVFILPCTSCQDTEASWSADGVISANEYDHTQTLSANKYELYWNTDEEYVYIGIKANAEGFVAVGFNPSGVMINSDAIFGGSVMERALFMICTYRIIPVDIREIQILKEQMISWNTDLLKQMVIQLWSSSGH